VTELENINMIIDTNGSAARAGCGESLAAHVQASGDHLGGAFFAVGLIVAYSRSAGDNTGRLPSEALGSAADASTLPALPWPD
jgi:hypothetical protein